jgi:hypothetical protein
MRGDLSFITQHIKHIIEENLPERQAAAELAMLDEFAGSALPSTILSLS